MMNSRFLICLILAVCLVLQGKIVAADGPAERLAHGGEDVAGDLLEKGKNVVEVVANDTDDAFRDMSRTAGTIVGTVMNLMMDGVHGLEGIMHGLLGFIWE
ncbi:uncharacterized protein [Periplaneta americana]|uniref:uncharacterized protein n=1 Tax=Periplaneta americana TaxID=6978 RepID=UPI0037E7EBFE